MIDASTEIVIDSKDIKVIIDKNVSLIDNNIDVKTLEPEYEITINRKEYTVVGDELYIPKRYEDAPQWLRDIIDNVTDVALSAKIIEINNLTQSLNNLIVELEVAKNTYTQSIISSNDINERINTAIETLNSSVMESDATILGLATTRVTPEQAQAISIDAIRTSLNDTISGNSLGSIISGMNETTTTGDFTNAQSIEVLESTIEGVADANATAMNYLNTYVGVSNDGGITGTGLLADVEILQKQNDGIIETISGTYDVITNPQDPNLAQLVISSEPYATWKASDVIGINTRLSHIGDVFIKYIDNSNGSKEYVASYKFIRTVVDTTSPYSTDSDGFTWALIIDQASQDAYTQALNAYDLADRKRRVFVSTPVVPYDIGDLWLVQTGATIIGTTQGGRLIQSGDTLRCCETKTKTGLYEHNDWIPADSYREGMNAIQTDLNNWRTGTYAPFVANIQSQVDKKSETFYQATVPTGRIKSTNIADNSVLNAYIGDLWKNTYVGTISGYLGDNTEYVYTKTANGSNWNYDWTKMEVPDIVFDTIDTKKSIYSGNSVPVAIAPDIIEINDMWITGSSVVSGYDKESIYVWNGTAWIKPLKYTDDTATVALQTGLANGTVTVKLTNAYVGTIPFTTYIASEIDGKVGVYSGETAPVAGQPNGVAINDIYLWFTTASKVLASGVTQVYDITRTYKYSGSAWSEITTDSNITALADLADGKRTVFSGNTVPVGAVARDIWIPSATNGSYLQGEIYQYSGSAWIVATKYSADLEAVRSNLQSQVDGKVETYYQATVPIGMTSVNNGDYWYCTTDVSTYKKGKVYKYVHTTTSWTETADVSRYAFDTADGKAAIFLSTSTPTTGYKINDMLIVIGSFNNGTTTFSDGVVLSSNANRVSGFTPADWIKKINDTEDLDAFIDVTYTPTVTSLQNQVDGKIESWYIVSTSDPKTAWTDIETKNKHNGDLWYQTDTKLSYYYSSSTNSWNLIDDAKAIQALADAAAAQASADGVVVSYYALKQDAEPATDKLWLNISGSKVLKKYNGSTWENVLVKNGDTLTAYNPTSRDITVYVYTGGIWATETENGLTAESEAITALNVSLAQLDTTVNGSSTLENSINARIEDGLGSVEAKFEYGSNIKVGGKYHNAGFGLKTTMTGGDGTVNDPYNSEFWINAEKFKFTNNAMSGQATPFSIDATGLQPKVTFNGLVTFGSGQTGTIEEAISSTIETIQVGDKNINITDNLIPITSLVGDTNNAGYQFIGAPVKSNAAGFSSFAEPQVNMILGDETYSLYVDEMTIPYYYRFAIKGLIDNSDLNKFKIVTIDSSNNVSYATIIVAVSEVLVSTEWYEIDGIINPVGGDTAVASGSIRKSDGAKIGTVNNFALPSGSVKLLLGWHGDCIISRMKLAKITADTLTGNYVTQDYVDNGFNGKVSSATTDDIAKKLGYSSYSDMELAAFSGSTVIDGGKLNTSLIEVNSIAANQINTTGLIADNISSNTIEGKTITGSVMNGGTINGTNIVGVTIRASYLDLDGELEILTDFYLCVGGNTTGVPALAISEGRYRTYSVTDIDAILSTEYSNLYRIPSISTLTYNNIPGRSYSNLYTNIWSYSTADSGNNNKARKRVPSMTVSGGVFSVGNETSVGTSASCSAFIYIGNVLLIGIVIDTGGIPNAVCYVYDHTGSSHYFQTQSSKAISIVSHGITFSGTLTKTGTVNLDGNVGALALASDWTSGRIYGVVGGNGGTPYFNIPTITINNMI